VSRCFCWRKRGRKKRRGSLPWATLNLHQTIRALIRGMRPRSNARSVRARAYNVSRFLILLPYGRDTSQRRVLFSLSLIYHLPRTISTDFITQIFISEKTRYAENGSLSLKSLLVYIYKIFYVIAYCQSLQKRLFDILRIDFIHL